PTTTWHVAQAHAPPHSATIPLTPLRMAVSMSVDPTSASISRRVPSGSMKVIIGMGKAPGISTVRCPGYRSARRLAQAWQSTTNSRADHSHIRRSRPVYAGTCHLFGEDRLDIAHHLGDGHSQIGQRLLVELTGLGEFLLCSLGLLGQRHGAHTERSPFKCMESNDNLFDIHR